MEADSVPGFKVEICLNRDFVWTAFFLQFLQIKFHAHLMVWAYHITNSLVHATETDYSCCGETTRVFPVHLCLSHADTHTLTKKRKKEQSADKQWDKSEYTLLYLCVRMHALRDCVPIARFEQDLKRDFGKMICRFRQWVSITHRHWTQQMYWLPKY